MYLALFVRYGDEKMYELAQSFAMDSKCLSVKSFNPGEFHYAKVAGECMQFAEILLVGNKSERALEECDKAEKILVELFGNANSSDMPLVWFIRVEQALEKYLKALESAELVFVPGSRQIT